MTRNDGYGTAGAPTSMSEMEAREITATIRTRTEEIWDLVVLAYQRRADLALGYESWDDYCSAEFGSTQVRIPAEDRPEVVLSLAAQGMSTRAIAAATGTSAGTVRRDLAAADRIELIGEGAQAALGSFGTPAVPSPESPRPPVTGLDGKRYPATRARAGRAPRGTSAPVRRAVQTWEGLATGLEKFLEDPEPVAELTPRQRARLASSLRQVAILTAPGDQHLLHGTTGGLS